MMRKIVLQKTQGADARACSNRNGLTLLHMAATCNHYEVIPVLVQAGIDINSADNKGNTGETKF